MMVPAAAGGPSDTIARLVAQAMSANLGQQVIIENMGGAGGSLGAGKVASAKPDGYTVLLYHIGVATFAALYPNLPYKPSELESIGLVTEAPMTIVARTDLPPANAVDMLAFVKKEGEKLTFGTAGVGAASHLCDLLFMRALEVKITLVPYKGTGPAMTDLVGKRIDMMCDPGDQHRLPDRRRPDQSLCGDRARTHSRVQGAADPAGGRSQGLRHERLARHLGAEGHPGRDPPEAVRLAPGGFEGPDRHRALRLARHHPGGGRARYPRRRWTSTSNPNSSCGARSSPKPTSRGSRRWLSRSALGAGEGPPHHPPLSAHRAERGACLNDRTERTRSMREYKIAAIPADGIGPEVISAGISVLENLQQRLGDVRFHITTFDWGSAYYRKNGVMMPADGLTTLKAFDAIYFGAVGAPDLPDHITLWGLRLPICQGFDQYANVRADQDPARHHFALAQCRAGGSRLGDRARELGRRVFRLRRGRAPPRDARRGRHRGRDLSPGSASPGSCASPSASPRPGRVSS